MNPFLATDGYKTGHHLMYPKGTTLVYSNFTPRSNKYAPNNVDYVVSFGQQMIMRQIQEMFDKYFFENDKHLRCQEIKKEYSMYLGYDYDVSHIEALWDLGYLPIQVKALPEGTLVPIGIPVLTIKNTLPEFYWLTNFLETLISNLLWKPITSATIAYEYKKLLTQAALKTDKEGIGIVNFQGHDFSMRGMDSLDAGIASGLGHATSFLGSDSLPVIYGARKYYDETGPVVHSVNATEHSVMCVGTGFYIKKDNLDWKHYGEAEKSVFKKLLKDFPTGILSVVSDTWDLWKVITEYLTDPDIKEIILSRDGKLVIRPDSGNPVDIVCGTLWSESPDGKIAGPSKEEKKGVIELLWDIFGGTTNEQGYKVLDSHIGAIYGDSITLERAESICKRLEAKGFASTNIVLGIGSFTYQYNTRDTFGFAMKATYAEVKDSNKTYQLDIFKDPVTDDGTKKSARGLLKVEVESLTDQDYKYILKEQVSWEQEKNGYLQTIFKNGIFYNNITLSEIRKKLTV